MKIQIGVCPVCGGTTRVTRNVDICTECAWYQDRDLAAFRTAWDEFARAIIESFWTIGDAFLAPIEWAIGRLKRLG